MRHSFIVLHLLTAHTHNVAKHWQHSYSRKSFLLTSGDLLPPQGRNMKEQQPWTREGEEKMWVREEWGKEERGREECRGWEGGGERRNEGKNKGRGTQGRNWEGKRKGRNWEKSKITSFWKFHKRGKMLTVEDLGSSLVLRLHTVFIACTVTVSCCVRHEIKGRGTPVFLCLYTGSFDFRLSEVTFSSTIICEWNWLPLTFTSTDKALLTCKWLYQGGVMFLLANPSPLLSLCTQNEALW